MATDPDNGASRAFRIYPDMVGRFARRGEALVADNAVVVGDVTLHKDANIWFGVTIRGDDAAITIGEASNVQDNSVIHVDVDAPVVIGRGVTLGHGVILHGIEVGDYALIGMGATVLGGARIGAYAIIGAGALVTENTVVPEGAVVLGVPGKVVRQVTAEERLDLEWRARHYVARAQSYLANPPADLG